MIKYIIRLHRILGTVLSILFVMWFLSGLVMIYHHYPSIDSEWLNKQRAAVKHSNILPIDSIIHAIPAEQTDSITQIRLYACGSEPLYQVTTSGGDFILSANNGTLSDSIPSGTLEQNAALLFQNDAVLTEKMLDIDVWLIGVGPQGDHPVHHYICPRSIDGRELYLSSRTGEPLQYTDSDSRLWAWLGPIPHWIYITWLRSSGRQPWTDVVLWLSGIGTIMVLLGIIIGIRSWVIGCKRRKKYGTPYVKPLFRWHHLGGMLFGLFVLTWIFSGYMSLEKVPEWMVPVSKQHNIQDEMRGCFLNAKQYAVSDSAILAAYPGTKTITWTAFDGKPVLKVQTADSLYLVDAADSLMRPFVVNTNVCEAWMKNVCQQDAAVKATLLSDYDNYYINLKTPPPLPVVKVEVDDADESAYYINPSTLDCRYYNNNQRMRVWLYKGLHCFSHSWFAKHDTLHLSLLWLFMIGGTMVSITGLVLGYKHYTKRRKSKKNAKVELTTYQIHNHNKE